MELKHFGIKGMKWGVRRKRGSDGLVVSKDHAESRALLKKPVRELSNDDIQKVNRRLNLESELKRLDPSNSSLAKRYLDTFLAKYGKQVIGAAAGSAAALTIAVVKKQIGHRGENMDYVDGDTIVHYGVMGMKWGVRKNRGDAASARADQGRVRKLIGERGGVAATLGRIADKKERRAAELESDIKTINAHNAKIKALKKRFKKEDLSRFHEITKGMQKRELEAYAKIDAQLKKDLEHHDKQSVSRLDKALGRSFLKANAKIDRSRVVGDIEKEYLATRKEKKEAQRKAEERLDTEMANRWSKRYDAEVKGRNLLESFRAYQKMDREISMETAERLLEIRIEHASGY